MERKTPRDWNKEMKHDMGFIIIFSKRWTKDKWMKELCTKEEFMEGVKQSIIMQIWALNNQRYYIYPKSSKNQLFEK